MSSASSDDDDDHDEQLRMLKEAAVSIEDLKKEQEQKKDNLDKKDKFEGNFVDVTPEFQDFIAKKLSKIIDDSIEIIQIKGRKSIVEELNNQEEEEPIYLMNNVKFTHEDNSEQHKQMKLKPARKKLKKQTKQDKLMLQEAAVSFDFILQSSCINEHKILYSNENHLE